MIRAFSAGPEHERIVSARTYAPPSSILTLLVLLALGWGVNWPIMKVVMTEMPPLHFRALCLAVGAAGLFAIARVARMHPHRVDVFDRADDDAVVFSVAHDLHLEFLPADHRLLDQQLVRGRGFQSTLADGDEFFAVVGDAAARPAESERRPDDGRKTDRSLNLQCLFQGVRERRARANKPYPRHGLLEFLAVLGFV